LVADQKESKSEEEKEHVRQIKSRCRVRWANSNKEIREKKREVVDNEGGEKSRLIVLTSIQFNACIHE
jgi:hypothetical protein